MPGRLDETRPFLPVNIALLTVSDTRTAADDRSGNTLAELAEAAGHRIAARHIVRDDLDAIAEQLRAWIADPEIDVVIATGGTGVTGRDVTPEAFHSVYEKEIAGFGELFRWLSYREDRHLDDPEPRHRRRRRRHLSVRAAGLARRLPRRLGGHPGPPARQPLPALQLRRADAAPPGEVTMNVLLRAGRLAAFACLLVVAACVAPGNGSRPATRAPTWPSCSRFRPAAAACPRRRGGRR